LLQGIGIEGVGLAWLIAEIAIASALLLTDLRFLWLPRAASPRVAAIARPVRAYTNRIARPRRHTRARDALQRAGLHEAWAITAVPIATSPVTVARVRNTDGREAVLHYTERRDGAVRLERRRRAVLLIRDHAPPNLLALIPELLGTSHDPRTSRTWILESSVSGRDTAWALASPADLAAIVDDAVDRMCELYRATSRPLVLRGDAFARLVDRYTCAPMLARRNIAREAGDQARLARVRAALWAELGDVPRTTSLVHGDLWLGNVLSQPGESRVSGIIDWRVVTARPPAVDIAHFLISTRSLVEQREYGAVVADLLAYDTFDPVDAARLARVPGADELSTRTIVLLAWLRHMGSSIVTHELLRTNTVWLAHNVHEVLETV
jgi:aminoglycoside phosphotransferase (APT) family kinase protein